MIDDIVEMILKEARGRKGKSLVSKVNQVIYLVNVSLFHIMEIFQEGERRKE